MFGDSSTSPEEVEKLSLTEQRLLDIKSKIDTNVAIGDHSGAIRTNRQYGRLIAFVTKTDPAIKLSVTKVKKLDTNGKEIPLPSTRADRLALHKEGKKLNLSEVETYLDFKFAQSKPGTPVAVVIKTPTVSEVDLADAKSNSEASYKHDGTFETKLISWETAMSYIALNYGGEIMEDDTVLGSKACHLQQKFSPATKTNKDKVTEVVGLKSTMRVSPVDKEIRSSLLTDGNFIPMKLHKTIAQQDLSASDAAILNNNVNAAMKNKTIDDLGDSARGLIAFDGTDYTSKWFNEGLPINVNRYDDKNAPVTDVRIPVRDKKVNAEDPSKITYKYVFVDGDDVDAGIMSNPVYKRVVDATGMSFEEFYRTAFEFTKRQSSGKKARKKVSLTAEQYLQAKQTAQFMADGVKDLADLQAELSGLSGFGM